MFAKALTMGGTGLGVARQLLASMGQPPSPTPSPATPPANGRIPIREE